MSHLKRQDGFTMVELLIAMAVFSFMLSIVLVGFIFIVRIQQAGIASRATQQNSRDLSDTISQSIRTSTTAWVGTVNSQINSLCLIDLGGSTEYALIAAGGSYDLYMGPGPSSQVQPCSAPASVPVGWRKLNDDIVAVPLLQISVTPPIPGALGTVSMTLGVASRDDLQDMVVHADTDITQSQVACDPAGGSQFCAATTLTTTTALRGTN